MTCGITTRCDIAVRQCGATMCNANDNAVRQCGATMQYNVRYDNAVRQCMQYDMRYDVRYYDAVRRRSTTMRYENVVLRCSTTCGTTARCDDAVQYMTMYSVAPM